jgi:hypothetical protein
LKSRGNPDYPKRTEGILSFCFDLIKLQRTAYLGITRAKNIVPKLQVSVPRSPHLHFMIEAKVLIMHRLNCNEINLEQYGVDIQK